MSNADRYLNFDEEVCRIVFAFFACLFDVDNDLMYYDHDFLNTYNEHVFRLCKFQRYFVIWKPRKKELPKSFILIREL